MLTGKKYPPCPRRNPHPLGCVAEVAHCNEVEKTLRIVVTSGLVNQARFTKGIRESLTEPLQKVWLF